MSDSWPRRCELPHPRCVNPCGECLSWSSLKREMSSSPFSVSLLTIPYSFLFPCHLLSGHLSLPDTVSRLTPLLLSLPLIVACIHSLLWNCDLLSSKCSHAHDWLWSNPRLSSSMVLMWICCWVKLSFPLCTCFFHRVLLAIGMQLQPCTCKLFWVISV